MSIHTQNTANSTRHVGTCGDKRVAIIIQDPQATHEVHVVDTDALPDAYHQNLMDMMMRPEAQASKWLGEYLHRQMLFDGTNALRQFYDKGWIQQVPVTSVYLTPRPNQSVSLAEVLGIALNQGAMDQPANMAYNPLAQQPVNPQPMPVAQPLQEQSMDAIVAAEQSKLDQFNQNPSDAYNQHMQNFAGDINDQNAQVAANLMEEARMLEADAAAKRTQAAQYNPATAQQAATYTPQPTVPETVRVPVIDAPAAESFVDTVTGKAYSSPAALKGAITRRTNAAKKAGNG